MRTIRTLEQGLLALAALDLKKVARKLMGPKPEGQGWNHEQVVEAEKWYRRFLELGLRYPEVSIVPNFPIDIFWHAHILDTRAYAVDCRAIFGEMLHHDPYFGLDSADGVGNQDSAFDHTNALYRENFGDDCTNMRYFRGVKVLQGDASSGQGHSGGGVICGTPACTTEERIPVSSGANCRGGSTRCARTQW